MLTEMFKAVKKNFLTKQRAKAMFHTVLTVWIHIQLVHEASTFSVTLIKVLFPQHFK